MEYKKREKQLALFNEWADFEGLDLKMSGEFEHSDKETHMAFLGYKAGQESKQASIDHMREYIISGMQLSTENLEYWIALSDCLEEFDRIIGKEK